MTAWNVPQGYLLIVEKKGEQESFFAVAASHPSHVVASGRSAIEVIGKIEQRELMAPIPLSTVRSEDADWFFWCTRQQRFLALDIHWNQVGARHLWTGLNPPRIFVTDSEKRVIQLCNTREEALVAALTSRAVSLSADEQAEMKLHQGTGIELLSLDGKNSCVVLHCYGDWTCRGITPVPQQSTNTPSAAEPPKPPTPGV